MTPQSDDEAWRALRQWALGSVQGEIGAAQWDQLRRYVDELLLWNRRMALVSQHDLAAILTKHVADSLVAAASCGEALHIADLGSGAGFPGIPIAILKPRARVCLMESTRKKVSFLDAARRAAGISNLSVFEGRIEAAARLVAYSQAFDVVTSRALAEPGRLQILAQPLLGPGGRILAMRSAREEESAAGEVISYQLPDRTPRRIYILPVGSSAVSCKAIP